MEPREPWLAVNLSYAVPGLGQLYSGRRVRGVVFLVTSVGLWVCGFGVYLLPTGNSLVGFLLLLGAGAVLLASLFDAHRCARRANPPAFESERKQAPDPWRALFLSRVCPGLGHFVLRRYLAGVGALVGTIVVLATVPTALVNYAFAAAVTFVAYHAYKIAPSRLRRPGALAMVLAWHGAVAAMPGAVRNHALQGFRIPGAAMAPALQRNDYVLAVKLGNRTPARGDVVVFSSPTDGQLFIKRCVAVAGDVVEIRGKQLYLNGEALSEPYVQHTDRGLLLPTRGRRDFLAPRKLPEDTIFVLGDNRDESSDSRFWGPLPVERVVGRVYKIYLPPSRSGPLARGSSLAVNEEPQRKRP